MINKYILGGCAAALLIVGFLGYVFYKQNEKLKKENELNKVQIQNYSSQITDLKESFSKAQKDVDRLTSLNNSITSAANKRKEELDKVLRTHDLEKIANRKASLMERLINRASNKTMGIFEKLSDPSSTYTNKIDFGASSLEKK
jgi:predicted  nucleic acid-binding Zn-ribbon protein|tara:strand:+ start:236 stop:667 length:432 start_codon:yes stop_codon:yes gene_type:complete